MVSYNRYFTHIDEKSGKECGRYRGKNPKQAASKCASKCFCRMKYHGQDTNQEIIILIREVTRGSRKKIYSYKAKLEKFDIPIHVSIGFGSSLHDIVYKHRIYINKTPMPQFFVKNKIQNSIEETEDTQDIVNDLFPTNLLTINHNIFVEV